MIGWLVMFHLTCYGWLLFRARSLGQIASMTTALVSGWGGITDVVARQALAVGAYTVPLLIVHAYEWRRDDLNAVMQLPLVPRYSIYVALAYLLVLFGAFGGSEFIYFQF
jgi:hypothetical protein